MCFTGVQTSIGLGAYHSGNQSSSSASSSPVTATAPASVPCSPPFTTCPVSSSSSKPVTTYSLGQMQSLVNSKSLSSIRQVTTGTGTLAAAAAATTTASVSTVANGASSKKKKTRLVCFLETFNNLTRITTLGPLSLRSN